MAWKDHGTNESGDAISFLAKARGITDAEALIEFRAIGGPSQSYQLQPRAAKTSRTDTKSMELRTVLPYRMTNAEGARCKAACERLAGDSALIARLATARNWKQETIRKCCLDMTLGWEDGKLAFIYESGLKLRWRECDRRRFIWGFGRPFLWRAGPLLGNAGHIQKVFLTEGETDAICLLDSEEEKPETLVCALPSASNFAPSWVKLFLRREVYLCFDSDSVGKIATNKVARQLHNMAKRVLILDWKAI